MTKDFEVRKIRVSSSSLFSSLEPQLLKTDRGFVLTGYTAEYRPSSAERVIPLSVRIEYREIEGLRLPAKVSIDADTHKLAFEFTDYHIKKR